MRKKNSNPFLAILVIAVLTTIGYAELKDYLSVSGNVTLKRVNYEYSFDYTGTEQIFTAQKAGYYLLETWGAGNEVYAGEDYDEKSEPQTGGYSRGIVKLNKGEKLYVNVGGTGTWIDVDANAKIYTQGGYNGGGSCISQCETGSGATHIAKTSGLLSSLENNKNDILIVSGGAAGRDNPGEERYQQVYASGGGYYGGEGYLILDGENVNYSYGGNQEGYTWFGYVKGTTQNRDGTFGQGGTGCKSNYYNCGGAGGGGFIGGTGAATESSPGGGGSGYIGNQLLTSKEMYCNNCEESNEYSIKTINTTNKSEEAISYYPKLGNGYAKITFIKKADTIPPEMDIRTETINGKTFAYIDTNDNESGIDYVTNGQVIKIPDIDRQSKKVALVGANVPDYPKYGLKRTQISGYNIDIYPTTNDLPVENAKNYDLVFFDGLVWNVTNMITTYFKNNINIVSDGNSTTSNEIIISDLLLVGHACSTSNNISQTIIANKLKYSFYGNDTLRLIKFRPEVEKLYTYDYDGETYDDIGYYNNNGIRWLHTQNVYIKNPEVLVDFALGINQVKYEITSSGDYTFTTYDKFGNSTSKTIHIDV